MGVIFIVNDADEYSFPSLARSQRNQREKLGEKKRSGEEAASTPSLFWMTSV
jgi:hypothetical protein